ncbi:histidine kinase [Pseudoduganella sp. FT93W]|uniref:Histidine kinase n=1 Tax=Duganella fentianensis TaxID=2692177 RepID=A0A845I6P4_9BURK|nr:CHASE domain-containing protein [Duganella fentianensis]MYN47208.1 histidine kinase [Duganella fentianensis]
MDTLHPKQRWFEPDRPVWWTGILLALLIGACLQILVRHTIEHEAYGRFTQQAFNTRYSINARLSSYTDVLRGTASFLASSEHIDRAGFHRYVSGLMLKKQFPALDNINYAQVVSAAQRPAFELWSNRSGDGRARGYPDFLIRPQSQRDSYTVLTMIEPTDYFRDRIGLDIGVRPGAAEALARARDTGQLMTTGMPIENTRNAQGWALALRMPIYRKDMPLGDVNQRRAAYIGSVGIGFSVPRLVRGAMEGSQLQAVHLRLYDDGKNSDGSQSAPTLLFDNLSSLPAGQRAANNFSVSLPLDFNGRTWNAEFSAPSAIWLSRFDAFLPWLAMTTGFIGALLFYLLFHTLASSRRRAIAMAKAMTQELRDSQARLQQSYHTLRQLGAHADQIKEQERKRIAREIHDDLGQNLLALRIETDMLATRTRLRHPRLHARACHTLGQIDSTIKSVRHIINDLRPTVLDLGLTPAVEWQIAQFRQRSGIVCELIEQQSDIQIDDHCATAIFRILQESLSNIMQHARASLVRVELRHSDGMLNMTISDNGIGMGEGSRNKVGSFGLVGMEERIHLLGGQCTITAGHHAGTTVSISVPVDYVAPPSMDDINATARMAAETSL